MKTSVLHIYFCSSMTFSFSFLSIHGNLLFQKHQVITKSRLEALKWLFTVQWVVPRWFTSFFPPKHKEQGFYLVFRDIWTHHHVNRIHTAFCQSIYWELKAITALQQSLFFGFLFQYVTAHQSFNSAASWYYRWGWHPCQVRVNLQCLMCHWAHLLWSSFRRIRSQSGSVRPKTLMVKVIQALGLWALLTNEAWNEIQSIW